MLKTSLHCQARVATVGPREVLYVAFQVVTCSSATRRDVGFHCIPKDDRVE
ncbi:MAG TPA: hypothetical protein VFT29_10530 [Gemmatimonadaceae bacterium]|nr:hypothetical protein [Gemmatimonadaceae bacterium]